jgi:cytidyltransferase-like protein
MTDLRTEPAGWRGKIIGFEHLAELRNRWPDRRIVHCHGTFDLVHVGHLIHFDEARTLGDVLVVTITADRYVTKHRAVSLSQDHRVRQVAALEMVDYVALVHEPSALTAIAALRPDVFVKGPDYADLSLDKNQATDREKELVESYGGRIHFTTGDRFSSTKLSHFMLAAPEVSQTSPLLRNERVVFRDISARGFTLEELRQFLAKAAPLSVCVVGETIIDEWVDVTLTNLSTQSHCVAGLETDRVRQVGGAGIIAQHLAGFVRDVHCFTNGCRAALPANVHVTNLAEGELVETRFVDREAGRPVFKSKSLRLVKADGGVLPTFDDYDLVLIADFGHGLLDATALNRCIADRQRALVAVMAQVNSSNYGYNLPIKYVGGDYYSLNRMEAELCLHERGLPLPELVERAAALLQCPALSVTDGADGVLVKVKDTRVGLPSLSVSVVDTIGCGDAHFALSSVAVTLDLPPALVALVGSIAAAAMSQRRCNDSPVTEQEFLTIGKIVI